MYLEEQVDKNKKLKKLSYYRTGGFCKELYLPTDIYELQRAMAEIHQKKLKFFILGAGSNSLILDQFWPGAVVCLKNMKKWKVEENEIYLEAGLENKQLCEIAYEHSLGGLAWMYGLPGQIGATSRMNARCYGGEISQVVQEVTSVTESGEFRYYQNLSQEKVFLGYKDTLFMKNGEVIAALKLSLYPEKKELIRSKMNACYQDRKNKKQFLYPSCGCVFKNNYDPKVGVPSGLLLEAAGAKNLSCGKALVNPYHSNFVWNQGASSEEILTLTQKMRQLVYEHFAVWLEYEMEILGALPKDLQVILSEKKELNPKEDKIKALQKIFKKQKTSK